MMKVADYINEMQRISEMYFSLFQSLLKDSGLAEVWLLNVVLLTPPPHLKINNKAVKNAIHAAIGTQ